MTDEDSGVIPSYADWESRRVDVPELFLDHKNIRIDNVDPDQPAIITDLFQNENAMDVLRSILEYGFLPDEKIVAVEENGQLVVLEGNRRIASLKAIINPELLVGSNRETVKRLTSGKDLSSLASLDILIAPNRDDADLLLASKHIKQTRREWRPLRRAYFYYAQIEQGATIEEIIQKYPNHDVSKYITMYEMHRIASSLEDLPEDVSKKLASRSNFSITNLERFYTDETAKEYFKIEIDRTTGRVKAPFNNRKFKEAFGRVVTDIARDSAMSRGKLANKETTSAYVKEVLPEGPVSGRIASATSAVPVNPPARPARLGKLLPSDLSTALIGFPTIVDQLTEAKKINYKTYKYSAALILRNLVELSAVAYLSETRTTPPQGFGNCIVALLDDEKERRGRDSSQAESVYKQLKENQWFNEGIKHNPGLVMSSEKVKEFADQVTAVLRRINKNYKEFLDSQDHSE